MVCASEDNAVVLKGEFVERIYHSDGLFSVVVKVVKPLKGEEYLSDTIILLGGPDDGTCKAGFGDLDYYQDFYLAFNFIDSYAVDTSHVPIINDSYKRFSPSVCNHIVLRYDEEKVEGMISVSDFIYSYPVEVFEQSVMHCHFDQEHILEYFCPGLHITPNPSNVDHLEINNDLSLTHAVDAVNVYTLSGQKIYTSKYYFTSEWFNYSEWQLPDTSPGIYIVEILCGENRVVEKVAIGF